MGLWPNDGYQPLSNTSETQGLPNPDVEIITDSSTSDSQALGRPLSNRPTSPRVSALSMHGSENIPTSGELFLTPRTLLLSQRSALSRTQGALSTQEELPIQSNVERTTNQKNEDNTSHPSSEDEETVDQEPENRRRISKWKHRILRPLRLRKLAATQKDLEDD